MMSNKNILLFALTELSKQVYTEATEFRLPP